MKPFTGEVVKVCFGAFIFERFVIFKQFCKEATDRQLQFDDYVPRSCLHLSFARADGWRFVVSKVATKLVATFSY